MACGTAWISSALSFRWPERSCLKQVGVNLDGGVPLCSRRAKRTNLTMALLPQFLSRPPYSIMTASMWPISFLRWAITSSRTCRKMCLPCAPLSTWYVFLLGRPRTYFFSFPLSHSS